MKKKAKESVPECKNAPYIMAGLHDWHYIFIDHWRGDYRKLKEVCKSCGTSRKLNDGYSEQKEKP